jgi:regulator of protease activity HflC (stomatin/prohibitin superfamily)
MNPLTILLVACLINTIQSFYVTIETGFVGVEYIWNKISNTTLEPGLQFYNPVTSKIEIVETRPQKDSVSNVECGTNDGLKLMFDSIEVGNILASPYVISTLTRFGLNYDKHLVTDLVRHQVNVICSKKSAHQIAIEEFDSLDDLMKEFIQSENDRQESGLKINFVRLTKPRLPDSIEKNYLALAEERTMKKVLEEKKERIRTEKESELIVAEKDNEIRIKNSEKTNEIMVFNMRAKQQEQRIQNEMIVEAARANAEKIIMEANALQSMYGIPGFVDIEKAKAISTNQKIFYGEKLPVNYPLLNSNSEYNSH